MTAQDELAKLRPELRYLRIKTASLDRAWRSQKDKADRLEKENSKLRKEKGKLEGELEKIEEELEKAKRQRDKYKGMIFKAAVVEGKEPQVNRKKLGGQVGHRGASRKLPMRVDDVQRVYCHHCPDCGSKVNRSESLETHTVEDIPYFSEVKTKVTRYERERQWCQICQKEVVARAGGVIPHSRLGINLIIQVLIWKYICRMSYEVMAAALEQTYGVEISESGLINILKRSKNWLGREYDELLNLIRGSPVKHADETSWRIKGLNGWLWAFLTKDAVYITIEHSRGKGVAEKILSDSNRDDVLVRDDYGAYQSLDMKHQSCWVHLLRESREAVNQKGASEEVKTLHRILKKIYQRLDKEIQKSFNQKQRQELFNIYQTKIQQVIDTKYTQKDTIKIQTRIRNQGTNLITAILYPDVPLTNNLAERVIRPSVIIRKISGGSRSDLGAQTYAINMSVMQSIKMRNQPLISTLHKLLLSNATGKY